MAKNISCIIFISVLFCNFATLETKTTVPATKDNLFVNTDSTLITGWYYILDNQNGIKRQLDRDSLYYFLDPTPIVTVKNISDFEIYTARAGDVGLKMTLDEKGTTAWREATEKSIGKRLAFVVDNKLLHVPLVNSKISFGLTALNRGIYSREDLVAIAKIIEREK